VCVRVGMTSLGDSSCGCGLAGQHLRKKRCSQACAHARPVASSTSIIYAPAHHLTNPHTSVAQMHACTRAGPVAPSEATAGRLRQGASHRGSQMLQPTSGTQMPAPPSRLQSGGGCGRVLVTAAPRRPRFQPPCVRWHHTHQSVATTGHPASPW
jgi:hypothetical protein